MTQGFLKVYFPSFVLLNLFFSFFSLFSTPSPTTSTMKLQYNRHSVCLLRYCGPVKGNKPLLKLNFFSPKTNFSTFGGTFAPFRITPSSHFQLLWFSSLGMEPKTMHFKKDSRRFWNKYLLMILWEKVLGFYNLR